MRKSELSKLLHKIGIPVNEGISSQENMNSYPRIIYWPYIEQDGTASGEEYYNEATYQISLFARTPQCEEYKKLRGLLRKEGIHPVFYHEYVENDPVFSRTWHTYCAVEVTEELEEEDERTRDTYGWV